MRLVALLALCAACGDNAAPPFVPLASGAAELTVDGDTLVFTRNAQPLLTLHAENFQIGTVDDLDSGASFDPYWLLVQSPPDDLVWHRGASLRVLSSDTQAATFDLGDGTLRITPSTDGGFALTFATKLPQAAYLRLAANVDDADRFYGLGEWGDGVEHRGKIRPAQLEVDTTIESSNNENHVPVPLVIGTRGWGLFVASDRPGVFDLAKTDPALLDVTFGTAEASAKGLRVHLFSADKPLDVLKPYYDVAGYPGLPAVWAYGPLLWRDDHRDQAQVLDDITQIRTLDLATSGIWFDRPYATGVNTFDWDATKFPAPATMLQTLHDAGLRYAIWQAPYAAAADNDQDQAPEQNAYATSHNFFPPSTGILVNQWGKPIDFTNPDAYAWWKSNLSKYTLPLASGGYGVEGFKLDYAEDVVLGVSGQRVPWLFADGSDERTMHYGYTMLYHRIHRELLDESGGFLLTRTGRWGDQVRGMIVWPGDLQADLSRFGDPRPGSSTTSVGGLPTALSFGIGLSASGFPFYASDTGGYRSSPPNNETWLRWVEANTVWSAMQVGDSSSQMPWEFTPENGRTTASLDIYRRYARLHMRLFPYAWSYAFDMANTGRPLVRPFGLAFPALDQHPADQYMFGDFLLVAPVITAGATSREVTFPPGTWIDWWTGDVHDGGTTQSVDAPLDTLPLYMAAGAIVPMVRDTIDTLAPTTLPGVDSYAANPGILTIRMTPGTAPTSLTLYDGATIEQKSDASEITFTQGTRFTAGVLFEIIARTDIP
ncbi:MAG: glycoside hydrolase family 31 protein, partial [Kofleriaceae bacterium]|nr:glycoside hydrolase family 31 protein [Kofleriaceae bacterium]